MCFMIIEWSDDLIWCPFTIHTNISTQTNSIVWNREITATAAEENRPRANPARANFQFQFLITGNAIMESVEK